MNKVNNKTLLLMVFLILITLLVLNYLFDGFGRGDFINYKKGIEAETLTYDAVKIKDRKIYYTLQEIVVKIFSSYTEFYDDKNELVVLENSINNDNNSIVKIDDYYAVLTDDYKKALDKNKYMQTVKTFFHKFIFKLEEEEIGLEAVCIPDYRSNFTLKSVYEIKENIYLCKLYSSENGLYGYIGIVLDTSKQNFRIFIIE